MGCLKYSSLLEPTDRGDTGQTTSVLEPEGSHQSKKGLNKVS